MVKHREGGGIAAGEMAAGALSAYGNRRSQRRSASARRNQNKSIAKKWRHQHQTADSGIGGARSNGIAHRKGAASKAAT
jgi:hypothetical protein